MTEYDTTRLTQAAANAQETIDRILQSEKDPQRQYLALLSEGCRIGRELTIAAAGGYGEISIDNLIKVEKIHTALYELNYSFIEKINYQKEIEFDGWPETPGITFLTCTGNSAQELMVIFFAAVSNEIHRNQPEKIFYAIESEYPPATLPVETMIVWITAVRGNLQERFYLNSKAWLTVQTEFDSLELKFEAEYKDYFKAKKSQKLNSPEPDFRFIGSGTDVSQVFFKNKPLPISPGRLTEILKKLADAMPVHVKYSDLGSEDIKGADEQLRTYKSQLNKILKKHTTYIITTYTGFGYALTPTP